MPEKEENEKAKATYTEDGFEIEGYGVGGKVQIVKREQPEFIRDIAPFFIPTYLLILSHIIFFYTGNLMLPIWLALTQDLACVLMHSDDSQDK
jgi:hypothetical protein